MLKKEDGAINWGLSANEISRRVRAYNPWPGAYTTVGDDLLHVWKAWPVEMDSSEEPGTILKLDGAWEESLPTEASGQAAFGVQTGAGILVPLEVQRSGRRALSAAEFLRGAPGLIGDRLAQAYETPSREE
jgi:methionyl-tRNA formyltransferase